METDDKGVMTPGTVIRFIRSSSSAAYRWRHHRDSDRLPTGVSLSVYTHVDDDEGVRHVFEFFKRAWDSIHQWYGSSTRQISTRLRVRVYLTPIWKEMPTSGRDFSADNVHSGYTTYKRGLPSNIVIWRREEARKVIVHELLHFLGFHRWNDDSQERMNDRVRNVLREFLETRHGVRPAELPIISVIEGFVETMATLLNARLNTESPSTTTSYIASERDFSFRQGRKVYLHCLDVWRRGGSAGTRVGVWSYYVIKPLLLHDTNRSWFAEYVDRHNGRLDRTKPGHDGEELTQRICATLCGFLKTLETSSDLLSSQENQNTLRMTFGEPGKL